jgi:pyrroline-5-carboxylate reductase
MTIAIIGTGNMGGAIMRGLIKAGTYRPEEFICTARTETTLDKIRGYAPGIRTTRDNASAVAEADVIILAVKPWLVEEVMEEIRPSIRKEKQIIVSVAAGVTLSDLVLYVEPQYNIIEANRICAGVEGKEPEAFVEPVIFRAIPNTAVEALCGVTVMAHHGASAEQVAQVQGLFAALGYALIVEEKLIPAATSLASCGIAFAMRYIRAAMEGGVELGFRPDEAARLVEHTVKGAATLLLESGMHPEVAIDKVTTAGGITIKGLNAMERSGFTSAVIDGLKASMV